MQWNIPYSGCDVFNVLYYQHIQQQDWLNTGYI